MTTAATTARAPGPAAVLVKEVNWLGDVVMSLPAVRAVRRAYPQARLGVLVKQELADFFAGCAWIDEVLPYRIRPGVAGLADRAAVVRAIRARRFDAALILPRSFESALWPALAGIPLRAGFASQGRSPLLTRRAPFGPEQRAAHQSHDYLFLVRETLAIEAPTASEPPDVHAPYRDAMRAWLASRRHAAGPLVALAVSAAYGPAKEWPATHFAALIDRLASAHGAECVLLGTPGERATCEAVAAATRTGALIAAGETTVGEAMALLSVCDGYVGNDSGATHVAAALGLPTVALFGSTNPRRTAPTGPRTRVLHHRLECSPCLARACRFGHTDCLRRITPAEVEEALVALGGLAGTHDRR